MTGHNCDGKDCSFVTKTEDDHIITEDGELLCMECYRKKTALEGFSKILVTGETGADMIQSYTLITKEFND